MSVISQVEREAAVAGDPEALSGAYQLLRKWGILILGGFCVLLLPWTAYLVYSLPSRHVTPHWSFAWVGFDLMMACVALWTILSIVRSSKYLAIAATVTGAFLVCDAWFDLVTSRPGSELVESSLLAGAGELPLAALCFWIALDAERICERRTRYFERRRSARASATA